MTEAEWLACEDPQLLLGHLHANQISERKLRLFAVACCEWVKPLVPEDDCRAAIEQMAQYADGQFSDRERETVLDNVWKKAFRSARAKVTAAHRAISHLTSADAYAAARGTFHECLDSGVLEWHETFVASAILLRHIVGNPFRPYAAPAHWPANVTDLAAALYNGSDCAFALHDALLEAGNGELAEHFREREHPKGCWALDVILGKA